MVTLLQVGNLTTCAIERERNTASVHNILDRILAQKFHANMNDSYSVPRLRRLDRHLLRIHSLVQHNSYYLDQKILPIMMISIMVELFEEPGKQQ